MNADKGPENNLSLSLDAAGSDQASSHFHTLHFHLFANTGYDNCERQRHRVASRHVSHGQPGEACGVVDCPGSFDNASIHNTVTCTTVPC